jgi:CRP-like cAMP-binding protein
MIGGRLQEAHQRLREISTEDVERRVAHAVLKLAGEAGQTSPVGTLIDFPLNAGLLRCAASESSI